MLVNGTEPRCGVINHYGWYEDAGYKGMKELTGRWQHIYICFDGRMEQVYINGEQVSGKDIQLLVKPSQLVNLYTWIAWNTEPVLCSECVNCTSVKQARNMTITIK